MDIVTSSTNPRLKLVRKLATRRGRQREGAFAVEGEDVVLAGLRNAWQPRYLIYAGDDPPGFDFQQAVGAVPVFAIDQSMMGELSGMAHPPRVIGVFELPEDVVFDNAAKRSGEPALYLDGVRDPGNVGTILRSANALGVNRIGLGPHTADPFGPKAARASMGAIFECDCQPLGSIDEFAAEGQLVVALDAGGDSLLHEVDLGASPVLCVGGEREGLGESLRAGANVVAKIPQVEGAESL
jgi:TrmH family RNA methyltransferase